MRKCLDSNNNIAELEKRIQEILKKLEELNKADTNDKNPKDFEEIEKSLHSLTRTLGDLYAAIRLQKALDASKEEATKAAKAVKIRPTPFLTI